MRKILACSALLLIICNFASSQSEIAGNWRGAVERLGSIQIVEFSFFYEGDSLRGLYNIPDMGLYEEPVSGISYSKAGLSFKFFMGKFQALYDVQNDEITGENKNWDPQVNIDLKRYIPLKEPFEKEFVHFNNKQNTTAGTLFKPAGKEKFPVVIIVHGSDEPQSRRNWRYRYFAYLLAKNGYGALIYDKQGYDSSAGNKNADFNELADDVHASVQYLKTRNDIEKNKIGILGISRGGWVAEISAGKYDDIGFAILFVGPAVNTWKQELDAVKYTMIREEYDGPAIDSAIAHTNLYFKTVKDTSCWPQLRESVMQVKDRKWSEFVQLPEQVNDSDMIWWGKNYYEPENDLKSVKHPFLAIFGEKDVNVPPAENENLMKEYLSTSCTDFDVKIIPGLPHNIHYNQTLKGGKWEWPGCFWIWPKKSLVLEETIINWMKRHCRE